MKPIIKGTILALLLLGVAFSFPYITYGWTKTSPGEKIEQAFFIGGMTGGFINMAFISFFLGIRKQLLATNNHLDEVRE